ncbi:MAG: MlaD family protein [Thermodesulfovibrionales bacterium]
MYDYIKQLRWAKLKVGIVITLALGVVFAAVMFAGSITRVLAPKALIHVEFPDVKGLRPGAPVWFSGVEIGSVRDIEIRPEERTIRVSMWLEKTAMKFLREDSTATILTLGLLGDKFVEISPGSMEAGALKPGDTISGTAQVELQEIVETSQESIGRMGELIVMLESVVEKIEKGEGTLSKFLSDPDVYNNLRDATAGLAKIVERAEAGKGSLGKLLSDDALYRDLSASARDIREFADALQGSGGTLQRLVKDPTIYNRFLVASASLEAFANRVASSGGTMNRLIEDESLYENLNGVSEKLNSILARAEEERLTSELTATLKELNTLIADIKKNPRKYFKFSVF